jgi:hypothetical protein
MFIARCRKFPATIRALGKYIMPIIPYYLGLTSEKDLNVFEFPS